MLDVVPEVGLPLVRKKDELIAASIDWKKKAKGIDAFVDALVADFPELRGLPFMKGSECSLDEIAPRPSATADNVCAVCSTLAGSRSSGSTRGPKQNIPARPKRS